MIPATLMFLLSFLADPQDSGKPSPADDFLDYSGQRAAAKKSGLEGSDVILGSAKGDVLVGDQTRGDPRKPSAADCILGGDGDDVIHGAHQKPAKGQFDPRLYQAAVDDHRRARAEYEDARNVHVTGHSALVAEGSVDPRKKVEWTETEAAVREQLEANPKYRGKENIEKAMVDYYKARSELTAFDRYRSEDPDLILGGAGADEIYLGPGDGSLVIIGPEPSGKKSSGKVLDGIEAKLKSKHVQSVFLGPGCAMVVVDSDAPGICRLVNFDPERHRIGVLHGSGNGINLCGSEVVFHGQRGRNGRMPLAHVEGESLSLILIDADQIDSRFQILLGTGPTCTQGVPYDRPEKMRSAVTSSLAFLKGDALSRLLSGEQHVSDLPEPPRGEQLISSESRERSLEVMQKLHQRTVELLGQDRFEELAGVR